MGRLVGCGWNQLVHPPLSRPLFLGPKQGSAKLSMPLSREPRPGATKLLGPLSPGPRQNTSQTKYRKMLMATSLRALRASTMCYKDVKATCFRAHLRAQPLQSCKSHFLEGLDEVSQIGHRTFSKVKLWGEIARTKFGWIRFD